MVKYEKRGSVGLLTIDRPEARNAVNGDVARGMEAAIDELEADDEVWVGDPRRQRSGVLRRGRPQGHLGGSGRPT